MPPWIALHPPHSHPASINASKNISEDNDYVTIDFPSVQPGTIIRTNRASGAIQMLQNNSNHHASTNAKKTTARSASDSALSPTKVSSELLCDQHNAVVKELQKTFNGTHRRQLHSLPSPSTADECGYEIPIAFQTPTYMTLDEIQTFPEQNVFGSPKINEELKLCRNKKVRLARYKRNVLDRSSASLEEEEYSHDLKQNQDEESHEDDIIENSKKINEAVPTPINSFLSARLKSCSFNCPKKHNHANTRLRNSLGSSGMTYSASGSDDDFSDDELESESHYQQIDFPHTNLCENAYERIYEILHSDHDRKPSRRKHPYEYVELETKDPVFTPLPCEHDLQQHHVKNFSEMRCNYAADCTWNTVATPGVLKLSNYKKTIENFYTVP